MRIFIDEAGIFTDPANSNEHKISVVGGLVIPDSTYDSTIKFFDSLKRKWSVSGEIKGNNLDESQVDELVIGLEKYNVMFHAIIVDTKFLIPASVSAHKLGFAAHILKNISPHHHPNVVKQLNSLSTMISKISDQLYTQSLAMTSLVHQIHQSSTLFYVQVYPSELARFKWIVDAKNATLTKSEKWWVDILKPSLHGMSITDPLIMLEGADYSYYNQFDADSGFGTDINKVMADLLFRNSKTEEGLQLVDILTTSLRKALNGKFQKDGWKNIGRLMMTGRNKDQNVVSIVLDQVASQRQKVPYYPIIKELNRQARPLIS